MLIVVKVIQCYVLYYATGRQELEKNQCKTVVEDRKGSQNYTLLTKIKWYSA